MALANRFGFQLVVIPVLPLVALHGFLQGWPAIWQVVEVCFDRPFLFMGAVLVGIVIHELVHALTWGIFGGCGFKAVRIGFQWKTMTPFAQRLVPLTARAYRLGVVMPGFLLGVLPAMAGSWTGSPFLAGFGWCMALCSGGDVLVLFLLRGVKGSEWVEDHPEKAGCRVVEN
jgi:hypothetical protein